MTTEEPASDPWPKAWSRIASLPSGLLLGFAWAVYAALAGFALVGDSPTADETVHMYSGYSQVARKDYRINTEHPPLGKKLSGLAMALLYGAGLDGDSPDELLYGEGRDSDGMLWSARAVTLLWGAVLIGTVYGVSRELYGPRSALISLVLATFCPLVLGHAHLVTTDIPVTALMPLTAWAAWRLWVRPGWVRCLCFGILLGGTILAKLSSVVLLAALPIAAACHWGLRRYARTSAVEADPKPQPGAAIWFGSVSLIVAWIILWGGYGFSFRASPEEGLEPPQPLGRMEKGIQTLRQARLFPEAFLDGLVQLRRHNADGHRSYVLGNISEGEEGWYFPFAFLVKTPLPTLLLFGWGMIEALRRVRRGTFREEFLFFPMLLYALFSLSSKIHIGLRHLLPLFPFLFIFAGSVLASSPGFRRIRIAGALALITAVDVAAATPHHLAYFNAPTRWFVEDYRLLADSNLDWGQDLRRLKHWMDEEGYPEIRLAWFGSPDPRFIGMRHRPVESPAGDVVALSVMVYLGVHRPDLQPWIQQTLQGRAPFARAGRSILLFRIPTH